MKIENQDIVVPHLDPFVVSICGNISLDGKAASDALVFVMEKTSEKTERPTISWLYQLRRADNEVAEEACFHVLGLPPGSYEVRVGLDPEIGCDPISKIIKVQAGKTVQIRFDFKSRRKPE